MKLLKKLGCMTLLVSYLLTFTVYASEPTWTEVAGNSDESVLLINGELSSKDEYVGVKRGEFLAAASSEIANGQDGTMTIIIDTFAHHDVDKIFHTAFLDQWDEETEAWLPMDSWDFEQYKEDTEDGTISYLSTTIKLSGYETNKYYRVRALHGVKYLGDTEACATRTDGVLITDGPT